MDSHASVRTKRTGSKKAPWITSGLWKSIHYRDIAKEKAIQFNDPQDWAVYKNLCNKIKGKIKSTKSSYYSEFIQSDGNSRKTWYMINKLMWPQKKNNASVKELITFPPN